MERENQILSFIFDLAREKLTCTRNIDGPYDSFSAEAKLAVIDVRLMLDYEPRRDATRNLEKKMVANNMRIAYHQGNLQCSILTNYDLLTGFPALSNFMFI